MDLLSTRGRQWKKSRIPRGEISWNQVEIMRNQSRFPWNQARKSPQPSSSTHYDVIIEGNHGEIKEKSGNLLRQNCSLPTPRLSMLAHYPNSPTVLCNSVSHRFQLFSDGFRDHLDGRSLVLGRGRGSAHLGTNRSSAWATPPKLKPRPCHAPNHASWLRGVYSNF